MGFGSWGLIFKPGGGLQLFSRKMIFCGLEFRGGFQESSSCRHNLSRFAQNHQKRKKKIDPKSVFSKSDFEKNGFEVEKNNSLEQSLKHLPRVAGPNSEPRGASTPVSNLDQLQTAESSAGPSVYEGIWENPLYFGPPAFKNRWSRLETRQVGLRTYKMKCSTLSTFPTDGSNEISNLHF